MSTLTTAELEAVDRFIALANACSKGGGDIAFGPRSKIRDKALNEAARRLGLDLTREPMPDDLPEEFPFDAAKAVNDAIVESIRNAPPDTEKMFSGRCSKCDQIIPHCICKELDNGLEEDN